MITLTTAATLTHVEEIQKHLKTIRKEQTPQFIDALINWYEWETLRHSELSAPPNLFQLFEYEHAVTSKVLKFFEKEILTDEELEAAHHDVKTVLNGYHMFYADQDDAYPRANYFNYFCKEVW